MAFKDIITLDMLTNANSISPEMQLGLSRSLFSPLRFTETLANAGADVPDRLTKLPFGKVPAVQPRDEDMYNMLLKMFRKRHGSAPGLDDEEYNTRAYLTSGEEPVTVFNATTGDFEPQNPSRFKTDKARRHILSTREAGLSGEGGLNTRNMSVSPYFVTPDFDWMNR